jgi:hypothetical protein
MAATVPRWIRVHLFWVYLDGIAPALSITEKRYSKLASALLGIMLFLFVLLKSVPGKFADRGDTLAFSGGCFACCGGVAKGACFPCMKRFHLLTRVTPEC